MSTPLSRAATSTGAPARLATLRGAMAQAGLDALIVPSSDPHLSEYLPPRWQGRKWLSGFTGSVGTLVVTAAHAGLWVDSRYWDQAGAQLSGSGIDLMKISAGQLQPHVDWLAGNLAEGAVVAVDGHVLSVAAARALQEAMSARRIAVRADLDLLETIWPDRPGLPDKAIVAHEPPYASVPRTAKLARLREAMRAHDAEHHLVSSLDDLAWLLNLRGSDVDYNPVFLGHALIGLDTATLFVVETKLTDALVAALVADGIKVAPYSQVARRLAALGAGTRLLVDPRRVTSGLMQAVPEGVTVIEAINPSTFAKSCKTDEELAHVRHTMEQDGAALCEFFAWFEAQQGHGTITELTIDERLGAARARRPGYVSASFATIAGFKANGAMPHYRATPEAHAVIAGNGLLLIDSGGQYVGGTTDITRVVPVGVPSAAERRDFTLVLKGLIALSRARFPRGVRAPMLDAIARAPIWAAGVDYGHGTGHGVGYFLNVHEGPQVISYNAGAEPQTAMQPGMITSIEPGIYRPGQWGVRIENLVANQLVGGLVSAAPTQPGVGFGEFMAFETLTLCPIDTRCIDRTLLRVDETAWLDDYHAGVRTRLEPLVEGAALDWLRTRTAALG